MSQSQLWTMEIFRCNLLAKVLFEGKTLVMIAPVLVTANRFSFQKQWTTYEVSFWPRKQSEEMYIVSLSQLLAKEFLRSKEHVNKSAFGKGNVQTMGMLLSQLLAKDIFRSNGHVSKSALSNGNIQKQLASSQLLAKEMFRSKGHVTKSAFWQRKYSEAISMSLSQLWQRKYSEGMNIS